MSIFYKVKNKSSSSKKNSQELQSMLLNLLHKRFNLYTQFKIGQLKQTHLLRVVRRDIARKKFFLSKNNFKKT